MSSRNLFLLAHTGFRQIFGCVYLNCCSTSLITVWHSRHRKVPLTSSGCTGWVRTTCPLMRVSTPILDEVSSRILFEDKCYINRLISFPSFFFFPQDRVSLCSLGCPRTHSVNQAGFKEIHLPLPPSAGIKCMCYHSLAFPSLFFLQFWGSNPGPRTLSYMQP